MAGQVTYEDILDHGYWHHRIPLGDGRVTPGFRGPEQWDALGLPDDLEGQSFLDVGTFDGLLAFEAERRGATEVLATDVWNGVGAPEFYAEIHPDPPGFRLAREYLDSDVQAREIGLTEISAAELGTFDVVVCAGVLSLVRDPLSAVENLVDVTAEQLVIAGELTRSVSGAPGTELVHPTGPEAPEQWWKPNLDGMERMLSVMGCRDTSSFYSPALDAREDDELPAAYSVAVDSTPVFQTREREEILTELASGTDVTVTFETGALCRITFTAGPSVQGWVAADTLDPGTSGSRRSRIAHLLTRAREIQKQDGIVALGRRGGSFLASKLSRQVGTNVSEGYGVAHGSVE